MEALAETSSLLSTQVQPCSHQQGLALLALTYHAHQACPVTWATQLVNLLTTAQVTQA